MNDPSAFIDAWRRGTLDRIEQLLSEVYVAAAQDLEHSDDVVIRSDPEDRTNLAILRRDGVALSRRFREALQQRFSEALGESAHAAGFADYALISEEELQSHLVGQPTVDALERSFNDVLTLIDSRLQSIAAELGRVEKLQNPVAPRQLITAFLHVFDDARCSLPLRHLLLHHFEKSLARQLHGYYDWANQEMAKAGYGLWHAHEHPGAALLAGVTGRSPGIGASVPQGRSHSAVWSSENQVQSWRKASARKPEQLLSSAQLVALRQRLQQLRAHRNAVNASDLPSTSAERELTFAEVMTVIALLQGEDPGYLLPTSADPAQSALSAALEQRVLEGARQLGIGEAVLAPAHADAIALVGLLFEALPSLYVLGLAAKTHVATLALPYLKLALLDPMLFDDAGHPAWTLLESVLDASDAADSAHPLDRELWVTAVAVIARIAADFHDDPDLFAEVLMDLAAASDVRLIRASTIANRVAQAIHGRERLQIAQHHADRSLLRLIDGRALLAPVADFLGEQWRRYLARAWLRDGFDSPRYRDAMALGVALIALDVDAAHVRGAQVADQLLHWQAVIADSYVSCGLDPHGAQTVLASLVAALSRPDAPRAIHDYPPLAGEDADMIVAESTALASASPAKGFEAGQALLLVDPEGGRMPARIAWVSPSTGRILLTNRHGVQQAYLAAQQLHECIADGKVLLIGQESLLDRAMVLVRQRLGFLEPDPTG